MIVSPQVKALGAGLVLVSPPELAVIILEAEILADGGPDGVGGQDVVLPQLTVCHRHSRAGVCLAKHSGCQGYF